MSGEPTGTLRLEAQLRLNDFDVLGHLNQAVYHELLEQGRIAFLGSASTDSNAFVLARVELDYRSEVPASMRAVTIETGVERIGRSSVTLVQRVLRPDGVLAAAGTAVLVGWDPQARRSRPLSDAERAGLSARLSQAPA